MGDASLAALQELLEVPGLLIRGADSIDATVPDGWPFGAGADVWGGVVLGNVESAEVAVEEVRTPLHQEWQGRRPVESIYMGEVVYLAALLTGWDADAVATVYPGQVTQPTTIGHPSLVGGRQPGRLGSQDAVSLLFAPEDLRRHPLVLLPRAVPRVDDSRSLQLQLGEAAFLAARFDALPQSDGTVTWRAFFLGQVAGAGA